MWSGRRHRLSALNHYCGQCVPGKFSLNCLHLFSTIRSRTNCWTAAGISPTMVIRAPTPSPICDAQRVGNQVVRHVLQRLDVLDRPADRRRSACPSGLGRRRTPSTRHRPPGARQHVEFPLLDRAEQHGGRLAQHAVRIGWHRHLPCGVQRLREHVPMALDFAHVFA